MNSSVSRKTVASPFSGRNVGSLLSFSIVSGFALAWLILCVITPMLTTPLQLGNLYGNLPYSLDWPYIINLFFQLLITVLILFAVTHNGMELINSGARGVMKHEEGPKVRRWTWNERIQHIWLFTTMVVLAVTGFAQLYYAQWGMVVINAMGGLAMSMSIHLLAAFFLGVLIAYHFAYYTAKYLYRRARGLPSDTPMMLTLQDIKDGVHNIKYLLGLNSDEPRYPKYDYAEKFDYWGIYWGTLILVAPGVLLWAFGINAFDGLPFVFHTDEAMLAVLFLLVFHFYQAHWSPREFPMNKVFLTGTMSEEDMRTTHPLELERIKAEGEN